MNVNARSLSFQGVISCALCLLFYLYQYTIKVVPNQCINAIISSCNASAALTGNMMSVFLLGYTIMQPIVAYICVKWGPKRGMMLGISSLIVLSTAQSYATSESIILLIRFFTGFGSAFALLGSLDMYDKWLPNEFRGRAVSVVVIGGMVGGMFSGKILVPTMLASFKWQTIFSLLSAAGIVLFLLFAFCVSDRGPYQKTDDDSNESISEVFSLSMMINCLYAWSCYIPLEVIANTLSSKISEDLGLPFSLQSGILTGMSLGLMFAGSFADKYGYKNILVPAGITNGIAVAAVPFVNTSLFPALFMFMGVITSTSILPIAFSAFLAPNAASSARSFGNFAQMGGASITAYACGAVMESFLNVPSEVTQNTYLVMYQYIFSVLGALMIISTILFALCVTERKSR